MSYVSPKDDQISFHTEIIDTLKKYNKTVNDVIFVTDSKHYCHFSDFLNTIKNYTYNDSWGIPYINLNLKIVGEDWWLERGEYDGSEWWEFKTMPTKPEVKSSSIRWKYDHNY
jgi:hypothetical protein